MAKFKKMLREVHGPIKYSYDEDQLDPKDYTSSKTLYDAVKESGHETTFELQGWIPEEKISHILREISIRTRINAQEIFKIGELLVMLKKICCEQHIKFKELIKEKTDFSYDTAQNFMNVYRYCFCYRDLALKISPSLLYNISSPSFPEDLRNWLFSSGVIQDSCNARLKRMVEKFREGGLDAVESEITEIGKGFLIIKQTNYTFDLCENALRTLSNLKNKVECRGGRAMVAMTAYPDQLKVLEAESAEINLKLFDSLLSALNILDNAVSESRIELNKFTTKLIV